MLLEKPQKRVVSWEGRPYKRIEYFPSRFVGVPSVAAPIVDFLSFAIPPRDSQVFAFLISCRGFLLPVSGGTAQL
jgi:hypothetical protein